MFKHIQSRLIALIALTVIIFLAIFSAMKFSEKKRLAMLFKDITQREQVDFDKVISFKSEALRYFATDYTVWDDMVSFLRTRDKHWAELNLDVALNSFHTDMLWVYNSAFSPVYTANIWDTDNSPVLPLPASAYKSLFDGNYSAHFFVETTKGIVEIYGATIHPTADTKRSTPARGYLFVGRLWTNKYLSEIAEATNSSVLLQDKKSAPVSNSADKMTVVSFAKPLLRWDGSVLRYIQVSGHLPVFEEIQKISFYQYILFSLFGASVMLFLSFMLMRWINAPLKAISSSLNNDTPKPVKELSGERTEFGHIARLILNFFEQKEKLLNEINEHKNTEAALRESEERYHALIDNAYDMIHSLSPDGSFIFVNPAWLKTMGYAWEELQGMNIMDIIHPEAKAHCKNMFMKIMSGESVKNFETSLITKRGDKIDVEGSVSLRSSEGKVIASQCIFRDITERKKAEEEKKRLEEQLLQSQKMEAVGLLAGGIAHDFNNILSAIVSYASLIQMRVKEDNKTAGYTEKILSLTGNASNLTKSLLAFSRRQVINPAPVDVNEIIKSFGKLMLRIIGEDIKLEVAPWKEDLTVMADKSQMEQILMNLATNARDAMPEGGSIIIRAELAELSNYIIQKGQSQSARYALVSFSDTGTGMNETVKSRVFEPFFTTKEVGKGTGLGLAMVYGIVRQHNGFIDISSHSGQGTTFKIFLPLIEMKIPAAHSAELSMPGGLRETILLGEDDPEVRRGITEILEEYGYTLIEANNGNELVKKYIEHKDSVTLIISDLIMPQKSGDKAYEEIKVVNPDMKFIFISGYSEEHIRNRMLFEEDVTVMDKPIYPGELLRKVREVLDSTVKTQP